MAFASYRLQGQKTRRPIGYPVQFPDKRLVTRALHCRLDLETAAAKLVGDVPVHAALVPHWAAHGRITVQAIPNRRRPTFARYRCELRSPALPHKAVILITISRRMEMRKISIFAAALILIGVGAWAMTATPRVGASTPNAVAGIALPF